MSTRLSFAVGLAVVATSGAQAFASEGGAPPNPFAGDLGNALWTLVIFVLVLGVLGKFLWGPILKGLQSREDFIAKSIRDADDANKKAQQLLTQYSEQLDKARTEASAIVDEGRRDAEVVKRNLQEEARKEANAIVERARREVGIARDTAIRELYDLGAKLATEVAGKIVAKEINQADHQRLIEESIAELRNVKAQNN